MEDPLREKRSVDILENIFRFTRFIWFSHFLKVTTRQKINGLYMELQLTLHLKKRMADSQWYIKPLSENHDTPPSFLSLDASPFFSCMRHIPILSFFETHISPYFSCLGHIIPLFMSETHHPTFHILDTSPTFQI